MNRRQLQLQIRAVTITHRFEQRRLDPASMAMFRERARAILRSIASQVAAHPDLHAAFDDAMAQFDVDATGGQLDDTG